MAGYVPLQQKAYEFLREKITNGELEYGRFYSETKMAKELGISRTPFKDALVRLSQDRYIDIYPSRGFCLHVISRKDVENTYESRTAVEGFCALILHNRREEKAAAVILKRIKEDIDRMEHAIDAGQSHETILSHDLAFHKRIVDFSENSELIKLYESYNHQLFDIAMKTFEKPERPRKALEEHKVIYNSIISSDDNAAAESYRAVMRHMESTKDDVLEILGE